MEAMHSEPSGRSEAGPRPPDSDMANLFNVPRRPSPPQHLLHQARQHINPHPRRTFTLRNPTSLLPELRHLHRPPHHPHLRPPLYPIARRFTAHSSGITVLQRIGAGIFLSIVNMAVAGLVEAKRIEVVKESNLLDRSTAAVPMRIWWLLPQYILCGLSDAFTFIGLQELFYDQMSDGMRSVGAAANLSITGVGNFLSNAIITVVQGISSRGREWLGDNINRTNLHYFYWVLVGLSALNLCAHVWVAMVLRIRESSWWKKMRLIRNTEVSLHD